MLSKLLYMALYLIFQQSVNSTCDYNLQIKDLYVKYTPVTS